MSSVFQRVYEPRCESRFMGHQCVLGLDHFDVHEYHGPASGTIDWDNASADKEKSLSAMQDRRSQRAADAGRCGEKYLEEYWAERPGFIGAVCHEPGEHRIHRDFTLGVQWL